METTRDDLACAETDEVLPKTDLEKAIDDRNVVAADFRAHGVDDIFHYLQTHSIPSSKAEGGVGLDKSNLRGSMLAPS